MPGIQSGPAGMIYKLIAGSTLLRYRGTPWRLAGLFSISCTLPATVCSLARAGRTASTSCSQSLCKPPCTYIHENQHNALGSLQFGRDRLRFNVRRCGVVDRIAAYVHRLSGLVNPYPINAHRPREGQCFKVDIGHEVG